MSSRRLEEWRKDWSRIVQIKKTVRKTGSYTITIMIAKEYNDKAVEILKAISRLVE